MEALRARALHWVKSRRGVAVVVLASVGALGSVNSLQDMVLLPYTFGVYAVAAVLLVFAAAWFWESKTAPGVAAFARPRSYSTQGRRLREDANARLWADHGGFLFERRLFFTATGLPPVRLTADHARAIAAQRSTMPTPVVADGVRTWWAFGGAYYWENAGYSPQDVLALLRDRERRQQRDLDRAHMLLNAEASGRQRREPINREMKQAVFARDGGACRECSSAFDLQYDHIIPVALGGATTIENLQLLCSYCNQEKGASI